MPKVKISEFSSTPANNTDIDSINISEGCAPSGINDAIRELMAQLKDFQTGAVGDSFNGPVGTSTAAAGSFTTLAASGAVTLSGGTANGVAYLNGSKVVTSGSALVYGGSNLILNSGGTWATDAGGIQLSMNGNDGYLTTYYDTHTVTIGAGVSAKNQIKVSGAGGANNINFKVNSSDAMALTSTGLGIGTSSPASKLDVNSTASRVVDITSSNASGAFLRLVNSATALGYLGSAKAIFGTNLADLALDVSGANNLIFGTNDTERARIDSSGNLLVGKTSVAATTVGFEAHSNGTVYSTMSSSANTESTLNIYSTGASAYRFYVGMGGTVYATNTTITAISDQRLKENIRDLDDGLSAVMALKPRKFDWKEGKGANIKDARGFIAQEFETVFPDMIEEWRDPAPEGEEAYKAINANLIPTLVKALQEQQAIIDSLKARLDAANL